jgi:alkylation response protein AidB-like acyl-CoA dehydrogenase
MDFEFSSDQEMLRDSVRKWVQKVYTFDHYRSTVKHGGFSQDHWTALSDLGLMGLAVPEAFDGLSMGPLEAMIVAEELGRGLVCEPWANSSLSAVSILRDNATREIQTQYLPKIADGSTRIAVAFVERAARYELGHIATTAQQVNGAWQLNGTKSVVAMGDQAHFVIVAARVDASKNQVAGANDKSLISLFLVDTKASGVSNRSYCIQDGSRAGEFTFANATAQLICQDGLPALERAADIGIAAMCAQAVGAMDQLMALTVDYMNTRKQFGAAIGSFQALRHRIADVKMQVELARSMSYYASLKVTAPDAERRYAMSAAKYQIGQSLRYVGQQCIQLHGGIGVTDEYSAGHFFKYLTTIELSLGDSNHHLGQVANRMTETSGVFEN